MKCPYCGTESKNQICDKCKALIPAESTKEAPKDESKRTRKNKDKE